MYDKLISDLRDYAEWADANSYEVPVDMPDLLREAADTIEKIEREERQWISVKCRLPGDNDRVIAFRPNESENSAYRFCVMWGWAVRTAFRHGITHWMSLPEPPKEEQT